jgi:phosphoribosylglycinamide formyltransferase-1
MLKLGVLISGRGTNLQSLIDACATPDFPARIGLVISNRPGAAGLGRAAAAGLSHRTIDHKAYGTREDFERDLDAALREAGVDLVCSAGFMRVLTPFFVKAWWDRQLNIHPSLLPAFRGLHVHEQALTAGVKISGCTVHFVRTEMDAGPILAQAAVPVHSGDTPDSLAARVLEAEHQLYPYAVRLIGEGKVRIEDERVVIADGDTSTPPLFAPAHRAKP